MWHVLVCLKLLRFCDATFRDAKNTPKRKNNSTSDSNEI